MVNLDEACMRLPCDITRSPWGRAADLFTTCLSKIRVCHCRPKGTPADLETVGMLVPARDERVPPRC